MDTLTLNSKIISPQADKPLTPAMIAVLWIIADAIDRKGIKAAATDALWLKIPSAKLRGENARSDNVWLRECLKRLTGMQIGGEYRGDPWGAVMVAEWHIEQKGSLVRLLIPPAAVNALRAPETFAKVEEFAAHSLTGAAKRLYASLADKKNMDQKHWTYGLDELRHILEVSDKPAYQRWNNLRFRVLDPALKEINDYGTVAVKMKTEKLGRMIAAVTFSWNWKSLDDIRDTDQKNEHHSSGRNKDRSKNDAPPLSDEEIKEQEEQERQKVIAADKAAFRAWKKENPKGDFAAYMNSQKNN